MNRSILDGVVDSRLPPVKPPESKLKKMEELRQLTFATSKGSARTRTPAEKNKECIPLLLLHENAAVRHSIRSIGKAYGFHAYNVSSFTQATRTLDLKDNVGVMVVDLSVDYDFCEEKLRQLKQRFPNISVVGLTGDDKAEKVISLLNKGLLFMSLPEIFSPQEFQKSVVSAHKRHKMLNKIQNLREDVESDARPLNKLKGFLKKTA